MKLVLSRKGFDSSYGGWPSPILEDGRMIPLPIPYPRSPHRYRDIEVDGINLGDLVPELTKGAVRATKTAHWDPQLEGSCRGRCCDAHGIAVRTGWPLCLLDRPD